MTRKEIVIETKIWDELKIVTRRMRVSDYNFNPGKLISELLIEFKNKKIEIKELDSNEIIDQRGRKFELSDEALNYYEELPRGNKSYVINGILRSWLENYNNKRLSKH